MFANLKSTMKGHWYLITDIKENPQWDSIKILHNNFQNPFQNKKNVYVFTQSLYNKQINI